MRYRNAGLISAAAMTAVLAGCGKSAKEEEAPASVAVVKVAQVTQRDLDITVTAPGTIFAREQANIASRVTAPIRILQAKKGDSVTAGQVLAQLDNRDAEAQRADAAAQLADAQAALERLKSGTVPAEAERLRGQVETAQAAFDLARKNVERRQQLFDQGAIPNRDLLQSQTDLAQAGTALNVAKRSLDLMQNQTTSLDIRSAQARVDSAKARLELAATQLQFTEIRSPFAGTITDQMMYPGDMASPSAPTFQLMDLAVVNARAQVPDNAAAPIRAGQHCEFVSSDAAIGSLPGRVTTISRALDPQRRTVEVWCEIENPQRRLQGNVFGNVTVTSGHMTKAAVVPKSAVQFKEGTRAGTVLVVDDKMVGHIREIQAGDAAGDVIPVMSGLQPGESVVVEGGYGLPDKTQLQLAKADNPSADKDRK